MATRQPSIGPGRSDFYYRTKGAAKHSLIVPRENEGVIAKDPGWLLWARFELASSYGNPVWLFLFDSIWAPSDRNSADPSSTGQLVLPPAKIVPGETLLVVVPPESVDIWQPTRSVQDCQVVGGRQPIMAVQESLTYPLDNGCSFSVSETDDDLVTQNLPTSGLVYVVARYRNCTR